MADATSRAVLQDLLVVVREPGEINAGLAHYLGGRIREALDLLERARAVTPPSLEGRRRMPSIGVPLAAINGAPDGEPPLPPAAL